MCWDLPRPVATVGLKERHRQRAMHSVAVQKKGILTPLFWKKIKWQHRDNIRSNIA
jgi:hypothetical protein